MNILTITQIIVLIGLGICLLGITLRIGEILRRPFKTDLARAFAGDFGISNGFYAQMA